MHQIAIVVFALLFSQLGLFAKTSTNQTVNPIKAPKIPFPLESASAGITKFSFLVYGDTRGRRDGKDVQYEHSLVIDSMLSTIAKAKTNGFPVEFVLQSGDAVVNGNDPKQWNASFVTLINRLTTEGGVSYFLAPGNHDVTSASEITSTNRQRGLSNYLAAVNHLIPPNGALRRLDGYPVFAFGFGNSFFLALDSNLASDLTQYAWASEQLHNLDHTRYPNIFAFFHHPPFSSGGHGGAKIEAPARDLRQIYMPLFREHHVRAIFTGHEHLFEHWVERYVDSTGKKYRMDQIVTGGGGAPLYGYRGEPDLTDYLKVYKSQKVELEHLVRPGPNPGDNPYHYLIVQVDGTHMKLDVIGIDWGSDFKPYRSNSVKLE
ncbi:MAG: metallophosphoesterase [Verrucomicrobiales bacterium]|nr:metallophosphoesterase [Verrucomicrobiales bacterium]